MIYITSEILEFISPILVVMDLIIIVIMILVIIGSFLGKPQSDCRDVRGSKIKAWKEECKHKFELSQITTEATNITPAGSTNFFYQKIAYVICTKCGEVRKQEI